MSKTAFIFPGQGAQTAGMGKDFYENSRKAKDIFDMASELLSLDMRKLCFEKNDLLDKTEYTQAALVTVSMAAEHVLREWGMTADVTAGLSLGEYCAAASAGAFSTEDAVLMVRKRGIFMEEAVPANKGAMAAVIGLTGARTEEVLEKIPNVWIANYNCPGQLVITGEKSAVETAGSSLKEAGTKSYFIECERSVSFSDDGNCRTTACACFGECQAESTGHSLCIECDCGFCGRNRRD